MTAQNSCKCGAKLVPLFSSLVCSAECDLPPERRTKPKPSSDMCAKLAPHYQLSVGTWTPKTQPLENGCKGATGGFPFQRWGGSYDSNSPTDQWSAAPILSGRLMGTHTDLRNYARYHGGQVECPRCGRKIDANTPD